MPTTAILTYNAARLEPLLSDRMAGSISVTMKHAAAHYARGTILGQVTATKDYLNYLSGAVDGSQVPKGILMYDIDVDASGNITLTGTTSQAGGDLGQTRLDIPMYIEGIFATEDLTGLDAAGLTAMAGRLVFGVIAGPGAMHF